MSNNEFMKAKAKKQQQTHQMEAVVSPQADSSFTGGGPELMILMYLLSV
jgi:hypothetical protein